MKGIITKIQRFSLHDGPGIRTTVFLKGCPLTCVWCQNPETITDYPEVLFLSNRCLNCQKCLKVCPNKCFSFDKQIKFQSINCNRCGLCISVCQVHALDWSSYEVSTENVLSEIVKDKLYYEISGGGVTFSGGEPLAQADFCYNLAKGAKSLGIHVAIDTSGYMAKTTLEEIAPFIDLFLFDIKFIDYTLHQSHTGRDNDVILNNFRLLCKLKKQIIVRVPMVSGITDTQENLLQIDNFVRQFDSSIKIVHIPFNLLMSGKYNMLGRAPSLKTH
jgi:pyruvate formate lyase activating enzyme